LPEALRKAEGISMSNKLHLLLADVHFPVHCRKSIRAVFEFIERHRADIESCVLLGDFLDCENLSAHTKGRPRLRKRGGYKRDIDGFKADILDPLDKLLKPTCKKAAICGNHENWIQANLLDEEPELEGVVDVPVMLDLEARNWRWIPCGGHIKIGKITVLHGDQIGTGPNIAKKLVDSVHGTAIMGHVHRPSMATVTSLVTAKDKWSGYTLPCLCTVAPAYAKGRPNAFCTGFGIIEEGTASVNVHNIIITNGAFSWGGVEYGA
jgi:predicted phosphodiesterase